MTDEQEKVAPTPPVDEFMLDLAKLHGAERPLVVRLPDGARYELRRREAMGPADLFRLDKVMRRISEVGKELDASDELTAGQDTRLRDMVQDTLKTLSPELAALNLCFADQFAILNWYGVQSREAATGEQAKNAPSA